MSIQTSEDDVYTSFTKWASGKGIIATNIAPRRIPGRGFGVIAEKNISVCQRDYHQYRYHPTDMIIRKTNRSCTSRAPRCYRPLPSRRTSPPLSAKTEQCMVFWPPISPLTPSARLPPGRNGVHYGPCPRSSRPPCPFYGTKTCKRSYLRPRKVSRHRFKS